MATSGVFRYALDPTGMDPNNSVIGEVKTMVQAQVRSVVPSYGPFFTESMVIYDNTSNRVLIRGTDYKFVELLQTATLKYGKEVAQMILVINPAVSDTVRMNYQVLGGLYQNSAEGLQAMYDSLMADQRGVEWVEVLNKPLEFPPTLHQHFLDDVWGWEPVIAAIERLRNAVVLSDVPAFEVLMDYFQTYYVSQGNYQANLEMYKYVRAELLKSETQRLEALITANSGTLGSHLSDADPHSQYYNQTRGDARYVKIADATETAQDAVNSALTGASHNGVTFTYDDANNRLALTNTDKGSTAVTAHEAAINPHPQYLLDNKLIGGRNLARNSSFEISADNGVTPWAWSRYSNTASDTFGRRAGRFTGTFSACIKANEDVDRSASWAFGVSTTNLIPGGWKANTTYVVSFYAKKIENGVAGSTVGSSGVGLNWNTRPATTVVRSNPPVTNVFQRYEYVITWGATTENTGNFYISAIPAKTVNAGDELWIDDLVIQEGQVPTAYITGVADQPEAYYRVASRGTSAVNYANAPVGFHNLDTGEQLNAVGTARSYMFARLHRYNRTIDFIQAYDVYGAGASQGGRDAAALAADLNATTNDYVVVVWTFDEPQGNRLTGGLPAALYRHGASPAVFESPDFQYRSAYILVGIANCGEGNGYEVYRGASHADASAYCTASFQLRNGYIFTDGTGTLIDAVGVTEATTIATTQSTAAITAHNAAADPHPQYLTTTDADAIYLKTANLTESAQDAVGVALTAGTHTGITVAYDDTGNKVNLTNSDRGSTAVTAHAALADPHPQYLTQAEADVLYAGSAAATEAAQDAAASMLTTATHTGVSVTYDDAGNKLAITNTDTGSGAVATHVAAADPHTQYLNQTRGDARYVQSTALTELAQDATGAMIAAGTHVGVTLAYDDAGNKLSVTNTDTGSAAVTSHNAATDPHTQYLNQTRGDARYPLKTDITELSQDAVAAAFGAATHTGVSVTYNDVNNTLALANTDTGSGAVTTHVAATDPHTQYYNQTRGDARYVQVTALTELSQDAAASLLTTATHDGVSATYDDAGNKVTLANTDKGSAAVTAHNALTDPHTQYLNQTRGDARYVQSTALTELAQDATAAMIAAGTHTGVSLTYDDANNKLSVANTDTGSAAVASHVAAADPHAQYLQETTAASTYAPLASPVFTGVPKVPSVSILGFKPPEQAVNWETLVYGLTEMAYLRAKNTGPLKITAATTLTATAIGRLVSVEAEVMIKLPDAATLPTGSMIIVGCCKNGASIAVQTTATDGVAENNIFYDGVNNLVSGAMSMRSGDQVVLISDNTRSSGNFPFWRAAIHSLVTVTNRTAPGWYQTFFPGKYMLLTGYLANLGDDAQWTQSYPVAFAEPPTLSLATYWSNQSGVDFSYAAVPWGSNTATGFKIENIANNGGVINVDWMAFGKLP